MITFKHLGTFRRTLKMSFIKRKIDFFLTWSAICIKVRESTGNQEPRFAITETKPYVPVVTLSAQDNLKLLQQLKTGFKRTINWNKYKSEPKIQAWNRYLNSLIDPSFQEVNWLLVLCTSKKLLAVFSLTVNIGH